jgi:phospholipid/cholesterol/gamma-HCH transport system substrate-binding protein
MTQAARLGLFILAALAIFAGAVFLIGLKRLAFQHTYELKAEFQNVAGLNNGAEVRVGGIHTGTVRQISLPQNPDGKVTVIMDMAPQTRAVLRKDSVAAVRSEGLVGDQYVEVSFGTDSGRAIKDGDTIASEPPVEISGLMKKVNGLLDTAQGAVQNVAGAADNLESISRKINNGSGSAGEFVNNTSVYKHVDAAANELQDDMEALKHNFLVRGFFKKRGYEDESDLTAHSIPSLPEQRPGMEFDYNGAKIFAKSDTAKLSAEKNLNEAGEFLQNHPFGLAVIASYGNDKGDSAKLKALSEARAAVVRGYLVDNFKIDDTRVKTIGLGKAGDASEAGKLEILAYPQTAAADSHRAK